MKKNVIKNMTKKSKIICGVCILLFIALVGVIIFKCFNATGSVNETGQNIDNNSAIEQKEKSKELITISGYTDLYNFLSTDDINNIYSIDDNKYSIIISGESNSIVVNDSIIFESKQKLYSVDLYYDIFVIYTASDSSDFKSIFSQICIYRLNHILFRLCLI